MSADPISMIATDGMLSNLAARGAIRDTSVAELLAEVHDGAHESYFAALEALRPPAEMEQVRGWMHENEPIPWSLVLEASRNYAARRR